MSLVNREKLYFSQCGGRKNLFGENKIQTSRADGNQGEDANDNKCRKKRKNKDVGIIGRSRNVDLSIVTPRPRGILLLAVGVLGGGGPETSDGGEPAREKKNKQTKQKNINYNTSAKLTKS